MPFNHRPVSLHLNLSVAERWAYWLGALFLLVAARRFLFPSDWPYEFLPFALAVPAVCFLLGRWPGIAFLPASGIAAVLLSGGPDGHLPQTATGFVLYVLHGGITCWLIDQLQSANIMLRTEQQLHGEVLATQSDWVMRVDASGKFSYLNPAAAAAFGLSPHDAIGTDWKPIAVEEDLPAILASIATLSIENPVVVCENRLRTAAGDVIWGHFINHGIFDEHGVLAGIQSVGRDITRHRLDQAEIRRLNEGLEQRVSERTAELLHMTEELEAFTYSLSHDLRAPIRSINATAAILLEEQHATSREGMQEGLTQIQLASRRMAELMDALLSMSTTARKPLTLQPFNHASLVDTAIDSLLPGDSPRRAQIEVLALPPGIGQPQLVLQVWENLLSNALKFTGRIEAPRIVVGFEPEQDACFVRDNGTGLDMRFADRIFKPFERAHDGAEFAGTGVGLAISDKIIRRHGGRIWCESAPGKGTTFRFTLNRMQEAA